MFLMNTGNRFILDPTLMLDPNTDPNPHPNPRPTSASSLDRQERRAVERKLLNSMAKEKGLPYEAATLIVTLPLI